MENKIYNDIIHLRKLEQPFIEYWHDSGQGPLSDASLSQQLNFLPAGQYTLVADMLAVRQQSWLSEEEPGINVESFVNDVTVNVSTADGVPQHYTIDFTLSQIGSVELGMRWSEIGRAHV